MKIKEIRLQKVKVFQNDEEIYFGQVDNIPENLKISDIISMHFDSIALKIYKAITPTESAISVFCVELGTMSSIINRK